MIYITEDKHADFKDVFYFCYANKTTIKDTLIVLGDAGINYIDKIIFMFHKIEEFI